MALTPYIGGQPGRTYEADETALTVGVCEDVLRMTRADLLMGATDEEASQEIARSIMGAFMDFWPVVHRIFPGMTEEEYRACLPRDVGAVMLGIVGFTIGELSQIGDGKPKNRRKRRSLFWTFCSG